MVHLFSNSAALAFFGRSLPRSTQPHTALGTCWHGWIHDRFFRANAATLYLSMTFADIWLWWTSLLPSTVKLFPIKICWTKHEKFRSLFWSWWITSLPTLQPSNPSNFWPMIPPFQRLELPMAPPTVDTVPGPKALHAKESLGPSRPLRFWPGSREALNQLQFFFQPCWHKNITFSHTKITT